MVYEYGSKALNSVFKAYKESVKQAPKTGGEKKHQEKEEDKKSGFGNFSFNNLISSPMHKDEALKILNIKEADLSPEKVMENFEKYCEANDPMKGGSFYIQNKIDYAKEFFMENYPKELNKSKFNPDGVAPETKEKKDPVEKNKNDKIIKN